MAQDTATPFSKISAGDISNKMTDSSRFSMAYIDINAYVR